MNKLTLGVVMIILDWSGMVAAQDTRPIGIFVSKGTGPATARLVNFPHVDGWLAEFDWSLIEPAQGQYNWKPVESDIVLAKRLHKKITLLFRSGPYTPTWLYKAGAKSFSYTYGAKFRPPKPGVMPIPWDATFLKHWTALIREAGKRFNGEAVISHVHISGSTKNGTELHLPFDRPDVLQWNRVGYSEAKVIAAWKPIIDAYAEAFPAKPLDFEIHQVLGSANVAKACIAYGSDKLGKRFGVFAGWLSGLPENRDLAGMHAIMRNYGPKGFSSFQMIGNQSKQPQRFARGGLTAAVQQALTWNGHYFEIWLADAKDQREVKQIQALRAAIQKDYDKTKKVVNSDR